MGPFFWIKRFLAVASLVFAILMAVELWKAHAIDIALLNSLVWSVVSSAIFTGARIYHSRQGRHCAICRDTPETTSDK